MAIEGGSHPQGKAPQRPATMFPLPLRRSRATSTSYPPWSANARVVAIDSRWSVPPTSNPPSPRCRARRAKPWLRCGNIYELRFRRPGCGAVFRCHGMSSGTLMLARWLQPGRPWCRAYCRFRGPAVTHETSVLFRCHRQKRRKFVSESGRHGGMGFTQGLAGQLRNW